MRSTGSRLPFLASVFATLFPLVQPTFAADRDVDKLIERGEAFFNRRWEQGKSATPRGDGLGPLHNDVSCVACHSLGGIGGAGGIEKNIVLLSIDPKPNGMKLEDYREAAASIHPGLDITNDLARKELERLRLERLERMTEADHRLAAAASVHPSLAAKQLEEIFEKRIREQSRRAARRLKRFEKPKSTLLLHKFSTTPGYSNFLERFAGIELLSATTAEGRGRAMRQLSVRPVTVFASESAIRAVASQRNTPALFGAGLIDRLDRREMTDLALKQRKQGIVSGVVAGKFGWKGQTAKLHEFVRAACANELGLQAPGATQAIDPSNSEYRLKGHDDLTRESLWALTSYVASLPAPRELPPADVQSAEAAKRGKEVFVNVGCAQCHVETLGTRKTKVTGIYSDLLLHDMGAKLADPVPSGLEKQGISGGGGYGGGGGVSATSLASVVVSGFGIEVPKEKQTPRHLRQAAAQQEWRTPPLWGVRDSAPYLHDGRASNLTEAIMYHGGEAKFSVEKYLELPQEDRITLIDFLHTLAAPIQNESEPLRGPNRTTVVERESGTNVVLLGPLKNLIPKPGC